MRSLFSLALFTILFSCEGNKRSRFTKDEMALVVVSPSVISEQKEIIRVVHLKSSGQWNFFANESIAASGPDSINSISLADLIREVPLGQLIQLDSTLIDLAQMREGYMATRKFKGDPWMIFKDSDQ